MLTLDEAKVIVNLQLMKWSGSCPVLEQMVIMDEHTMERPWGWVFFYTTRGMRKGDRRYALGGNGPIIINRMDASMHFCGTAYPVECYVEEYEAKLATHTGDDK